jgi:opacity protein-like surface antigen
MAAQDERTFEDLIMRASARMLVFALALTAWGGTAIAGGPLTGVDAMSATILQQHQSSFSGIALRMRVHPPQLIQQVSLMPTIEYWRNSSNVQPFDIQSTRKDATMGIDLRYDIPREGFHPYVGAGFGIHFISTSVNAPSLGLIDASDSLIKGGLEALGGVTFGLAGRVNNVVEIKYLHVPDNSQLKINWGLAIDL